MQTLILDTETRSRCDIKTSNVYRYSEAREDFRVLMCTWSLNGSPVRLAIGHDEIATIPHLTDPDVWKVAHNAQFDAVCLSRVLFLPYRPEEWIDTAAIARCNDLPADLARLAKKLKCQPKDSAGKRLIRLFSMPARDGHFVQPEERPEEWEAFCQYGIGDTETLVEIASKLPLEEWTTSQERDVWIADQRINERGVQIDAALARAAQAAGEDNAERQGARMRELTGLDNPNSVPQLMGWLRGHRLELGNLQAQTVVDLLARDDLDPEVREALELRRELALVASKKYASVLGAIGTDNRLRGGLKYFGGHTGRWSAGGGLQIHNLPRAALHDPEAMAWVKELKEIDAPPEAVSAAKDALASADVHYIEDTIASVKRGDGADPHTLKALVRSMIVGPFAVADYSAIEARVTAWLAGEQWVLDAFEAGEDIYTVTANRMGPSYDRQQGKTAVLALGFAGGVDALSRMDYANAFESDEVKAQVVEEWRAANAHTVAFWDALWSAFQKGGPAGRVKVEASGTLRRIVLPSGRKLLYHGVKVKTDGATGRRTVTMFDNRYGEVKVWRGIIVENVVQAVARDLLAESLLRIDAAGMPVVAHIHDEILVECPDMDPAHAERLAALMCVPPDWATGLPLNAEGGMTNRYRKG